jgi:hypothetical protein
MVLLAAALLPQLVVGDSALYEKFLTSTVLTLLASPIKLLFLVWASLLSRRCLGFFERSNPARAPWLLLTIGLSSYTLGQAILAVYQVILVTSAPFPSAADLFFVPATALLAAALFVFVHVYRRAGYPVGAMGQVLAVGLLVLALLAALVLWTLRPVLVADAPLMEKALNVAYPVLDCFLLLPTLLLLRMAVLLRGGSLWRVWMALLGGFVCVSIGDILFAFFTTQEMTVLDPLLHLAFAYGYILMARSMASQYSILSA